MTTAMTTKLADLSQWDRDALVWELRIRTRPYIPKTDDEAQDDRERVAEILAVFGERYPEDVLDRFDA